MTLYREAAGSVAIATGGESSYGAGDTVTHRLLAEPPDMNSAWDRYDKEVLAVGKEESAGGNVLKWISTQSLVGPMCDKSHPIMMALCMGGDTRTAVDSTTASQHTVLPPGPSTELVSTAMEMHLRFEGSTNGFGWVGVLPESYYYEGSNDSGMWSWGGTFSTKGYPSRTVTSDLSALIQPSRCPYVWGQTFVKVATTLPGANPTISGASLPTSSFDPTGGWSVTDWSSNILGVRYDWNSGGIYRQYTGAVDGTASNAWRTRISQQVTLTHLLDDTNPLGNLVQGGHTINEAGEQLSYGLVIGNRQNSLVGSTFYHAFSHYFPRVDLVSVTPPRGNPRIFTSTWKVCDPMASGVYSGSFYSWNASTEGDYL